MMTTQSALDNALPIWSHLRQRWEATAAGWDDNVRIRFEREYWSEYERLMDPFLDRMHELEQALRNARHHLR
jgi:hypothetical protein